MSKKDEIFDMIMEMHRDTRFAAFDTDEDKIRIFIDYHLSNGFVYFNDGCLMMGRLFSPWYNNDTHATDSLLFVTKESRGKGLAKAAIEDFIEWAKLNDAKSISIAQSSGVNLKDFKYLADSLGLKKIGGIYNV